MINREKVHARDSTRGEKEKGGKTKSFDPLLSGRKRKGKGKGGKEERERGKRKREGKGKIQ